MIKFGVGGSKSGSEVQCRLLSVYLKFCVSVFVGFFFCAIRSLVTTILFANKVKHGHLTTSSKCFFSGIAKTPWPCHIATNDYHLIGCYRFRQTAIQ